MKEKKTMQEPMISFVSFYAADVITTSPGGPMDGKGKEETPGYSGVVASIGNLAFGGEFGQPLQ